MGFNYSVLHSNHRELHSYANSPEVEAVWIIFSGKWKETFSFGWKLLFANLLNRGYGEIYNLIIGKAFNTTTLGYYNKGKMLPGAFENGLTSVVTSVMFPFFLRNRTI